MNPGSGHPALAWARSGAMSLTGAPDGPPRLAPAPLASLADRSVALLRSAAPDAAALGRLDGAALLGERAAIFGLHRQGSISASGSCRLLRARDGWLGVNLARSDDLSLLPAWFSVQALPPGEDPWPFVRDQISHRPIAELVARARLLGLAVAPCEPEAGVPPPACRVQAVGERQPGREAARPLVVDLSALWAGPLCAHLLGLAGARVLKIESCRRPDGARAGPAPFFDLLNANKESLALDFDTSEGRNLLRSLVLRADIVVESARPRALAQLGVDAEEILAERPGRTWISITGYGRPLPGGQWIAFGDDAAVAAGLARATADPGEPPIFCGDAVADPLTGLQAAALALASFGRGGGELMDVSLTGVAAEALAEGDAREGACVTRSGAGWRVHANGAQAHVASPRARTPVAHARALGVDTRGVLGELGLSC